MELFLELHAYVYLELYQNPKVAHNMQNVAP